MLKIKLAGIYMIKIGDYYYIGKSLDILSSRWQTHYTLLKLNKHHSPLLQEKFNEFGVISMTFSILEYISITEFKKVSKTKGKELNKMFNRYLLQREKFWMSQYSVNFCLNKDNKYFSK